MRRVFVLLIAAVLPVLALAQDRNGSVERYLQKGAVPVKEGKVVFTDSLYLMEGYTSAQLGDVAKKCLEGILAEGKGKKNMIVSQQENSVAAVYQTDLVFQNNSLSYDKAVMECLLMLNFKDGKCWIDVERIKYAYDDGTGMETIFAEDCITYENAVNKKGTKLLPINGKFRRGTINAMDAVFASFRDGFKYYTKAGYAEIVKAAPKVMSAPQQAADAASAPVAAAAAVQQKPAVEAKPEAKGTAADMQGFRKISPEEIPGNAIKMISKDWMLITAGGKEKFNMMTASWGGFGVLYNKPVAICFVNPARYTYQLMESGDTYTLTFYTEVYRDVLKYCGSKSGRDEDKVAGSGLEPVQMESGAMAFKQAWMVIECKKLLSQSLSPDAIADPAERAKRAAQPMHKMYIGEILNVWVK